MIKSFRDLDIYNRSFDLAMPIFELIRNFPKEELYSLTTQIIRTSRSISPNVSKGWAKREDERAFRRHLIQALGSCTESKTWLDFSTSCNYLEANVAETLSKELDEIASMIHSLHKNWKSYE